MQYSILDGAIWTVNTTVGNTSVNYDTMYALIDYDDTPYLDLSSSAVFVMDFDFGQRVHLDRFEYKFISNDASDSAIASGIKFYFKDEPFDSYSLHNTSVSGSGLFFGTSSSGIFAPRYARVMHTLSGTYGVPTASGQVYGFKAINNDTIVDFGTDGTKTTDDFITSRGADALIREIPIYNSGSTNADAYINIEPSFNDMDDAVSISDSESGPWVSPLSTDEAVVDSSNMDYGSHNNTEQYSNYVRLEGFTDLNGNYSTKYESGYYDTPIFLRNDTDYHLFIINKELNNNGKFVVDAGDPSETIKVRFDSATPKSYGIFRELIASSTEGPYLVYRDRWLSDNSIKETGSWTISNADSYMSWYAGRVVFDEKTERWGGYVERRSVAGSRGYPQILLLNATGTGSTEMTTYDLVTGDTEGTAINFSWRFIKFDSTGGYWVYFYCQSYDPADFIHTTGNYLIYFDSDLSPVFSWHRPTEEVSAIDVNYDTTHVWYARSTTNSIYKLTTIGTVLVNYAEDDITNNVGGLAVFPDGSIIFANGNDLHRLSSGGAYLDDYFLEDVVPAAIDYLALDGDGSSAIWVIYNQVVARVFITGTLAGTIDFRVGVDYPLRLTAHDDGVWIHCADENDESGIVMNFISKADRRVYRSYSPTYNMSPGLLYYNKTNENYTSVLPVAEDTVWSTLDWSKVTTSSYMSAENGYHQLRVYLRRELPIDRYPEFVTDPTKDYNNSDDFTQHTATSGLPDRLLWGDWLNYPDTSRVYVDGVNDRLALTPNAASSYDAYVDTSNRMVVSPDSNGYLDIRVKHFIGQGNGIDTFTDEILNIKLHSLDPGQSGNYFHVYLRLYDATSASRVYRGTSGGYSYSTLSTTRLDTYEGELRFYWDTNENRIYGHWRPLTGGSFQGSYFTPSSSFGEHFYVEIYTSKDGSYSSIINFEVLEGDCYYYAQSPKILSIHKQELVKLEDIAPNSSKSVYLKTEVPLNSTLPLDNEVDLKARWRIPTY